MNYVRYPLAWFLCVLVCSFIFSFGVNTIVSTLLFYEYKIHFAVKLILFSVNIIITVLTLLIAFDGVGRKLNSSDKELFSVSRILVVQLLCVIVYICVTGAAGFPKEICYSSHLLLWAVKDISKNAPGNTNESLWYVLFGLLQALIFSFASLLSYFRAKKKQIIIREKERLHAQGDEAVA